MFVLESSDKMTDKTIFLKKKELPLFRIKILKLFLYYLPFLDTLQHKFLFWLIKGTNRAII
jgi:hypothetical protein